MKVLVYNFAQPGLSGKRTGGVGVYHANLLTELQRRGHLVLSMSSGDRYAVLRRDAFLESRPVQTETGTFEEIDIINSPVLAPAHAAFADLDIYVDHPGLNDIPSKLLEAYGAIDAFHFQNVEGLTIGFFEALRRVFPKAKLLYSAHNYNIVCPQVNLWFREHLNCVDYHEGRACINCLRFWKPSFYEDENRAVEQFLARLPIQRRGILGRIAEWAVRTPIRMRRKPQTSARSLASDELDGRVVRVTSDAKAAVYRAFREANIRLCEDVFDHVLAVSHRTKQVLVNHGVRDDLISTSYIGTAQYERSLSAPKRMDFGERLNILYLGYMRNDKGFFFFLQSLAKIPEPIAARINVTIAAPYEDTWALEQLQSIAQNFGTMTLYNGYSHDNFGAILASADLGIVPVLWEDNLPQVAIEMVAHGLPILTSSRGGAQEIGSNRNFIFKAGSEADFIETLTAIVERRTRLAEFWTTPPRLVSMESHVTELLQYYGASGVPQHHATSTP